MFYNEERKKEYLKLLEQQGKTTVDIRSLFTTSAEVERLWDKDLCDFVMGEILKIFSLYNLSSVNSAIKNKSYLKRYTDWCCNNRLSIDNINHYKDVSKEDLEKVVNKITSKIMTKEQVYSIVDGLLNYSDKFLILSLFEGVRPFDIGEYCTITLDDINEEKRTIRFKSGEEKIMSKKLYHIAIESSTETVYQTIQESGDIYESKLEEDTNQIIHFRRNATQNHPGAFEHRIRMRFNSIKIFLDIPFFNMPNLRKSGILSECKRVVEENDITRDEFFDGYETYIKEINPNYEIEKFAKSYIKSIVYNHL